MKNDKFEKVDLFTKLIAPILTIVIIGIGIFQYKENSIREFRKILFEEQYKLYVEVVDVASKLANSPIDSVRTKKFINLRNDFFVLYYGRLYIVQDTLVEESVVDFADKLIRYQQGDPNTRMRDMQFQSLLLGNACRKSIQKTWQIQLQELKRKKGDEAY